MLNWLIHFTGSKAYSHAVIAKTRTDSKSSILIKLKWYAVFESPNPCVTELKCLGALIEVHCTEFDLMAEPSKFPGEGF